MLRLTLPMPGVMGIGISSQESVHINIKRRVIIIITSIEIDVICHKFFLKSY